MFQSDIYHDAVVSQTRILNLAAAAPKLARRAWPEIFLRKMHHRVQLKSDQCLNFVIFVKNIRLLGYNFYHNYIPP